MTFKTQSGFWQLVIVLGILALVILTVIYGTRTQTYEGKLRKADKLFKVKRFDEAITLYVSLIDRDPKNPKTPTILMQIGDIYNFSLNKIDKAAETYDLITIRYPSSDPALKAFVKKAELFFTNDQFDRALKEYQNILENFPKLKEIDSYRLKLGICHLKLKQFEAARREFKTILDTNLNTPLGDEVLFQTANSYFMEGKTTQAIPIYQSLIEHFPKTPLINEAKFNLADCYEDLGEYDKALSIYKQIQNSYPNPKVIELQIQKNQERKVEAEKRKLKMGKDQPLIKNVPMLPNSQMNNNPVRQKQLMPESQRKKIIKDILNNYH